mmetsp:Transcript_140845/g.351133  ORF Transcript_140845/g.351133 Transcript_140845/m.351133 type:complete len:218 (+) Transcript_140845:2080-2733(+)
MAIVPLEDRSNASKKRPLSDSGAEGSAFLKVAGSSTPKRDSLVRALHAALSSSTSALSSTPVSRTKIRTSSALSGGRRQVLAEEPPIATVAARGGGWLAAAAAALLEETPEAEEAVDGLRAAAPRGPSVETVRIPMSRRGQGRSSSSSASRCSMSYSHVTSGESMCSCAHSEKRLKFIEGPAALRAWRASSTALSLVAVRLSPSALAKRWRSVSESN